MRPPPNRFIIVAAARTGSNLLRHMLGSHPDVFAGGEVFNDNLMKRGVIPWYEIGPPSDEGAKLNSDKNLNLLRETDPGRLVEELINVTHGWGYGVIGFKCMYQQPRLNDPAGRYLANQNDIRVIHLKRRNLLRRFVSWERAVATDSWYRMRGSDGPELPAITVPIKKMLEDIILIEAEQREYDERFKDHPMLEIFYEDLSHDPQAVGTRALDFLGVKADGKLKILLEKTGVDSLSAAVKNYGDLKSSLLRWVSFFED